MLSAVSISVRSTRAKVLKFVVTKTRMGNLSCRPLGMCCLWPGASLSVRSCSDTVEAVAIEESLKLRCSWIKGKLGTCLNEGLVGESTSSWEQS